MDAGIIDDIIGLSLFVLITYLFKKSYLKDDILIAGAIISFFVGVLVQKNIGKKTHVLKDIEKGLMILIVPFFFISMGLHFELSSLLIKPSLLITIILIAIIGKLFGVFLSKPFTHFNWKQLHIIGWGMNSRGAVGLALALIAFRSNLIPVEIYSSLVLMTLITTLIFPFIIVRIIRNDPNIMK